MFKYTLDDVYDLLQRLQKDRKVANELFYILSQMKLEFIIKLIEAYIYAPEIYKERILNTILYILNDLRSKYSIVEEVKVPSFEILKKGLKPIAVVDIANREYVVLTNEKGDKFYFMRVDSKSPKSIPERVIKEAYKILEERGEIDFDLLKDRTGKYTEAALAILALAKLNKEKYEVVYDKYGYPVKLRKKT